MFRKICLFSILVGLMFFCFLLTPRLAQEEGAPDQPRKAPPPGQGKVVTQVPFEIDPHAETLVPIPKEKGQLNVSGRRPMRELAQNEEAVVINNFLKRFRIKGETSDPPCDIGDIFRITARFQNQPKSPTITSVAARVTLLTNGNRLISADRGGTGVGAEQELVDILVPGEEFTAVLDIELAACKPFFFRFDMLGHVMPLTLKFAVAEPSDLTRVYLCYTEAMDVPTVTNPTNYTLSDGLSVIDASISSNQRLVTLTTDGHVTIGTTTVTTSDATKSLAGDRLPLTTQTVVAVSQLVDVDLKGPIASQVNSQREKEVVVSPVEMTGNVLFTSNDPALLEVPIKEATPYGARLFLKPLQRGTPILQARLGGDTGPIIAEQEVDEFEVELSAQVALFNFDEVNRTAMPSIIMTPLVPNINVIFTMVAPGATFGGGLTEFTVSTNDFELAPDPEAGLFFYDIELAEGNNEPCHIVGFDQPGNSSIGGSGPLNPPLFAGAPNAGCSGGGKSSASHFISSPTQFVELFSNDGVADVLDINATTKQLRWRETTFFADNPFLGEIFVTLNTDSQLIGNKRSVGFVTSNSPIGNPFFPATATIHWFFKFSLPDLGLEVFNKEPFNIFSTTPFDNLPPSSVVFGNSEQTSFFSVSEPDGPPVLLREAGDGVIFDKREVVVSGTILNPTIRFILSGSSVPVGTDLDIADFLEGLGFMVTLYDDTLPHPGDLNGVDLVVVSSTASAATVTDSYRASPVPGVMFQKDIVADMRLVDDDGVNISDQTQVNIIENKHFITSGQNPGSLTVSDPQIFSAVTTPIVGRIGEALAIVPGNGSQATILVIGEGNRDQEYEIVPARRVFFFLGTDTFSGLNATGLELLERSVTWGLQNEGVAAKSETAIVNGGSTIILTLARETWVPELEANRAIVNALIDGLNSDQFEPTGWNAIVKVGLIPFDIRRISDTVVVMTLPPFPSYNITVPETITVTVPEMALSTPDFIPLVGKLTFTITPD